MILGNMFQRNLLNIAHSAEESWWLTMEMRDRLIELLNRLFDYHITDPFEIPDVNDFADDLLANGVIVPPCKVGDMVYQIKYCRCGKPEAYEMKHCHKKDTKKTPKVYGSIMLLQEGKRLKKSSNWFAEPKWEWQPIGTICYKIIKKPFKLEWLTEIGKTVFLTKEEAEKALKEREGNGWIY
jgi:hypothetical protein